MGEVYRARDRQLDRDVALSRSSPSAFYRLDLQTGRNQPLSRDLKWN